jgi:predicted butyrate kinase (DUF1464 family)
LFVGNIIDDFLGISDTGEVFVTKEIDRESFGTENVVYINLVVDEQVTVPHLEGKHLIF